MLSDPISDMLTRIRNGGSARLARVSMPSSRLKRELARVLEESGFISGYQVEEGTRPVLSVQLRYNDNNDPMIEGLERVSRPSRRVYVGKAEIPLVRAGLGVSILTTPRGVLTDTQAREAGVGGEIVARVW